ncbi:carbohydrate ABC transporter permease [Hujiaoplasma nucleasis]|uniref:Carbohydrate ABC transporter permease n=1 Tax=Hujiaoplasma nucleasis TaxID=2725268 RepID=A0A7L6N2T6_9MOLU|nr:carbohydrate ABC transporter permease [Hujiaoplasma nucleasis]QLY39537.1 carbohydrate ABC transporter permease [Hujiaoplasma nucleasis]
MSKFSGTKINPKKFHRSQTKFFVILIPLAIFVGLPIVFIINHAFKPTNELYAWPPRFFVRRPTIDNFRNLVDLASESGIPFSRYLFNSILVTVVGVFLSILITSLAAYGLSKLKFKGKKLLFEINTLALMFVPIAVTIPRYLTMANIGLIDTYFGLILPLIAIPVGMFLVKQFIDQTPNEVIESAKIDGASEMQIFLKIIMPIIAPAVATVGILSFQLIWNDVVGSSLYVDSESLKTLPFYFSTIAAVAGNPVAGQGMMAAASFIMFVPNIVLFIFLQSKVMNTMAHSGIK